MTNLRDPLAPVNRALPVVLLVGVLAVALAGAYATQSSVSQTFDRQTQIQQAQVTLEEMLRLQIDAENSVRGFTETKDPFYRSQYAAAVADFHAREATMRRALQAQGLDEVQGRLDDYEASQAEWRAKIAEPLLAHPDSRPIDVDRRNKFYTDFQSRVANSIRTALADRSGRLASDTLRNINVTMIFSAIFFLIFFGIAFWIANRTAAVRRELDRERTTTETLQRVFVSTTVPLPHCDVGSAYAAASSDLAVGGDVFDMYRLSDSRALVFIADVSGKGVDAAVLTAFIRFTIRSIALRRTDPGRILAEFNTAFAHTYTAENPSLFVSMFVGVLDTDAMYLEYASAGHDTAFVRRSSEVRQLAITGPILGVMEEPFETRTIRLDEGDTIVLATDGLTEARYTNGDLLHEEGAMELIGRADPDPQRLADELVARVRELGGNRMRDDLAILAIRVREPGGATNA